jgi:hypothetical protein
MISLLNTTANEPDNLYVEEKTARSKAEYLNRDLSRQLELVEAEKARILVYVLYILE